MLLILFVLLCTCTFAGKWGLASCCLRPQIAFSIVTNLHQNWVNNVYGIYEQLSSVEEVLA